VTARRGDRVHGLLLVDKPAGPTSHDVVAWARRALGTRAVGHTGTLDPAATGLLVLLVGEATKLAAYLVADDQRYDAVVALGAETDTLDAAGAIVATAPVPPDLDEAAIRAALQGLLGRRPQVVPAYSAVKRDGRPLHERARRGEIADLPAREVTLHAAEVTGLAWRVDADGAAVVPTSGAGERRSPGTPCAQDAAREARPRALEVALRLHTGSGYFVRSLARDLGRALGTRGHLRSLRRIAAGRYALPGAGDPGPHAAPPPIPGERLRAAAGGDGAARAAVAAALAPLAEACRGLPTLVLSASGVEDARCGRTLTAEGFADPGALAAMAARLDGDPGHVVVAVASDGEPVALVRTLRGDGARARVVRGFAL
jgi:tRNA pseudouridine55 synthase